MNELKTLPKNFEILPLKLLNISYNCFRKFPPPLLRMKSLCVVEAKGNVKQWNDEDVMSNSDSGVFFELRTQATEPDLIIPGTLLFF
jgi:hypothetical protein